MLGLEWDSLPHSILLRGWKIVCSRLLRSFSGWFLGDLGFNSAYSAVKSFVAETAETHHEYAVNIRTAQRIA